MALKESRRLADDSAWTVSLESSDVDAAEQILSTDEWAEPPAEDEVFVVGTFKVVVDAKALERQGFDLSNEGAEPWASLFIEFVSDDGKSYDPGVGTVCYTDDMLYDQGSVYDDQAEVEGDVCLAVPSEHVDGGLWRVSNMENDNVWISPS